MDSKKLEYGPGTMLAGVSSSPAVGVGGQSYSNFLASTVGRIETFLVISYSAGYVGCCETLSGHLLPLRSGILGSP